MARKIGNLVFPTGKYIKDGEEKTSWMRVGVLLETDKGMRIKLDAIPVVTDSNGLWLSVFEDDPKPKPLAPLTSNTAPASSEGQPTGDDDLPF